MFKAYPASLQAFIDTPNCVLEDRVQYSTVHIPNIFCVGHLQYTVFLRVFLYCNRQVHRDFLITLYSAIVGLLYEIVSPRHGYGQDKVPFTHFNVLAASAHILVQNITLCLVLQIFHFCNN